MKQSKLVREHPDYLSGPVPTLAPLPVSPANLGKAPPGFIPWAKPLPPSRDPDAPQSPPTASLYATTMFPGMLFSTVKSSEELFRKGSSFLIVDTSINSTFAVGYVGPLAEKILLGGAVPFPQSLASLSIGAKYARPMAGSDLDAAAALLDGGSAITRSGPHKGTHGAFYPEAINTVLGDMVMSTAGGSPGAIVVTNTLCDFNSPAPASAQIYIMAVHTFAEHGWFGRSGAFSPFSGSYQRYFACDAVLFNVVETHPFKQLVAKMGADIQREAPSDLRRFIAEATRDELLLIEDDDRAWAGIGVVYSRSQYGADFGSVHGVIKREVGLLRPSFTRTTSAPRNGAVLGPSDCFSGVFAPGEYAAVASPSFPQEAMTQVAASMCLGLAAIRGRDIIAPPRVLSEGLRAGAGERIEDMWVRYADAVLFDRTSAQVQAEAEAKGSTVPVGGLVTLVPTTAGIKTTSAGFEPYSRCPITFGVVRRLASHARRIYARAENYARAS